MSKKQTPKASESGTPSPRSAAWSPTDRGIIAVPLALFAIQVVILWPFGIDDVGISYRYALHLAQGEGLTWNPGSEPVEGYSNLLWVLILAAAKTLGMGIEFTAKLLGVLLGALNIVLLSAISKRMWSDSKWWWLPGAIVVLSSEWVAWTVSGLEIAMFGSFLLLGLLSLTYTGARRAQWLSVSVAGLALTRPEGALLAGVMIVVAAWLQRRKVREPKIADFIRPFVILVLVSIALVVFRMAYYGYPFPNTVVAKFDQAMPSASQIGWWLFYIAPLILSLVIAWRGKTRPHHAIALWTGAALSIVQILIVLPVVPVMHFLHRYDIAFLPLVALSAPFALIAVKRRFPGMVPLAVGVFLLWSMQGWPAVWSRMQGDVYIRTQMDCVIERLRTLPGRPTVALQDAGHIPFKTDLPALDAWGLCDVEIARDGFTPETVLKRRPAVYVMSATATDESGFSPRIGMDEILVNHPAFKRYYGMWTMCTGDGPPEDWAYDYGIFIDVEWAKAHGFSE